MCPTIALPGEIGTERHGLHPSPVIAESPDVFLDGKPVARQGDPLAPHVKPNNPPHPRSISEGIGSVLCSLRRCGKPIAMTGTGCGGVAIGSGNGQAG
ncbi:PAAR domain-containing protein [Aeromonas piscicola]|uniref:PAAR domain-containing protein n=1 Tax=Aeromonas piscicola TaxID=600645 RepID=A0ABT7QAG9_9GAMM|nr:PAAR domain-containing protein [Aeromonas piscicola]MDM5130501.1 PAAR domain-containing protein [Aeromonas piscicola]